MTKESICPPFQHRCCGPQSWVRSSVHSFPGVLRDGKAATRWGEKGRCHPGNPGRTHRAISPDGRRSRVRGGRRRSSGRRTGSPSSGTRCAQSRPGPTPLPWSTPPPDQPSGARPGGPSRRRVADHRARSEHAEVAQKLPPAESAALQLVGKVHSSPVPRSSLRARPRTRARGQTSRYPSRGFRKRRLRVVTRETHPATGAPRVRPAPRGRVVRVGYLTPDECLIPQIAARRSSYAPTSWHPGLPGPINRGEYLDQECICHDGCACRRAGVRGQRCGRRATTGDAAHENSPRTTT